MSNVNFSKEYVLSLALLVFSLLTQLLLVIVTFHQSKMFSLIALVVFSHSVLLYRLGPNVLCFWKELHWFAKILLVLLSTAAGVSSSVGIAEFGTRASIFTFFFMFAFVPFFTFMAGHIKKKISKNGSKK